MHLRTLVYTVVALWKSARLISSLIKEEDRIASTGDRLQLPERLYEISREPFEGRNAIEVVDADGDDTLFPILVEGDPLDPVKAWIGKTEIGEVDALDLEVGHGIVQVSQVLSPVDVRIRKGICSRSTDRQRMCWSRIESVAL